jgi:hypothetical protein
MANYVLSNGSVSDWIVDLEATTHIMPERSCFDLYHFILPEREILEDIHLVLSN